MITQLFRRLFHRTTPGQIGLEDYLEKLPPVSLNEIESGTVPPKVAGIYVWYFDSIPGTVAMEGCLACGAFKMLYLGQASNLRKRILVQHYHGDANSSPVRLCLGCLLQDELSTQFHRRWSRRRPWFGKKGEEAISTWMRAHARVAWVALTDEAIDWPRKESDSDADALSRAERKLINTYVLPLNLKDNFNEDAQASVMAVRRIVDACRAAASIPLGDSDI